MVISQELSLQARVFQYFRDHPSEAFSRDNTLLYAAFHEGDPKRQKILRTYKQRYVEDVLDYWGKKGSGHFKNKKKKKTKEFIILPKKEWQEFKEFVGFVDEEGNIHEGEAIPEPIDVDTGDFIGILRYQLEGFDIIEYNDNILILWPRGHGKTWLLAWYIEWNMKHSVYKAMYLSITDVINDVADWVYEWAFSHDLLAEGENVDKTIRRSSPKNFRLTNGSKFKIFSIMEKKVRGKHDYTIFMDDIIEEGSLTHPSYQRMLERRWNSTISKMRRNKLVIVNTRVYEGDFIEYLMKQFDTKQKIMDKKKPEERSKWELYKDIRTPFIEAKPGEPCDEQGFLLNDEGERVLLAPELYDLEYFEAMEAEDFESFMAEMMQDPTSIQGGMLSPDDIIYRKRPLFDENVKMVGIGVDLSWADESDTADMSAVVSMAMHGELVNKKLEKRFTVLKEDVELLPLYDTPEQKGIFSVIDEHARFLVKYYPNIPLIIAIERNSGGMVIIKVAQRERFWWVRRCVSDKAVAIKWEKDGSVNVPLGITHKKNKIVRIFGGLQHSIKTGETQFDWSCEATVYMAQLLSFPKGKHDDGPDATEMIKDELNRRWSHTSERTPRENPALVHVKESAAKKFEQMKEPWKEIQRNAARKNERLNRTRTRPLF